MARERRSGGRRGYSFRGKVRTNIEDRRRSGGSTYLKLPSGVPQFVPEKAGEVILDFLPYEVTDKHHLDRNDKEDVALVGNYWWKKPFKTHRNIGAERKLIVCPTTIGLKCPICRHIRKELDAGIEYDELKDLVAKTRVLYCVVPRNSSTHEPIPHIMDMSYFLFQELLDEELDAKPEKYEDFAHPDNGYALKLRFTERTLGRNKFFEVGSIRFLTRKKPISDELLDAVPNLDEVLEILPYQALNDMFLEDPDDEPDEKNEGGRKRDTNRRNREVEDDYTEAQDDDPDDHGDVPETKWEEQEQEQNEKKRRRRRDDDPDDDPDDGYDEPDDEPEPKQRRRRRDDDPDDGYDEPDDQEPDDEPEPKQRRRRRD